MADTYAVVQKRSARAGGGPGAQAGGGPGAQAGALYSQVAPRAQRPGAQPENARVPQPGRAHADQSPSGPDAYEEVADGFRTGGLGFNLRIGRPKGPRDPPAEWTRV